MTAKLSNSRTGRARADSRTKDKNIIYAYYRRLCPPDRRVNGGFILESNLSVIGSTLNAYYRRLRPLERRVDAGFILELNLDESAVPLLHIIAHCAQEKIKKIFFNFFQNSSQFVSDLKKNNFAPK